MAAAAHVFADHGYAAGTTDRIAERAGISIGSLYQYYPNKDAILVALAQAHLDDTTAALRTHLTHPRPLEQWLPAITRALVDLHLGNPGLHRVLFEQAPRPPELLARFHEAEQEAVTVVDRLLRDDPGVQVSDTLAAARYVVAVIESLIHRFTGHEPGVDPTALTDQIVYLVTRYLR